MPDGSAFRDDILVRYDFTATARNVLQRVPVEVETLSEPPGGGYWYPNEQRIFLYGIQDEACVHELAHAWADLTGFYVDPHPDNPHLTGRHYALRADVERAASETDPAFRRVAFLAWEYTYGNPATGFAGMGELDWERFAGLASGVMGDTRLMPPYLRRWYDDMFGGNPAVPGPRELPSWAPPGWQQGAAASIAQLHSRAPDSGETGLVAALRRWWRRVVG